MGNWAIPAETVVTPKLFGRFPTRFRGCAQTNSIFLKSNGKLTCSCSRYWHVLADARKINVGEFFNIASMKHIRESFRDGFEPFDFCATCISRQTHSEAITAAAPRRVILHFEPSSQCNLFCSAAACTCTYERQAINAPTRTNLDFDLYGKVLNEIKAAGIEAAYILFVGFGEPLFNSRVHDMAQMARSLFPSVTKIYMDTNANFGDRRAAEIAHCGLDEIRLGIDGCDQESYSAYREGGNFQKAFNFARKLAAAIRETKSPTKVTWKYILFRHNDRDEQITAAVRMADEIGISIIFDQTGGELASTRPIADIHKVVGAHRLGCNIDLGAYVS
jgi:hypothetical protein